MSEQPVGGEPAAWHWVANGQQQGPAPFAALVESVKSGRLPADAMVWRPGLPQWVRLSDTPEFAAVSASLPPQPPPLPSEGRPNGATWIIGMHDKNQTAYHQGRLIGSIDSMIFGLLSLVPVLGVVFAIMALPVATKVIGKNRLEPGRYSGVQMARVGVILSVSSLLVHLGFLLLSMR